uniref:Uncharacterized protein n=1 Tax=Eutreptiella gymnastica TaxID=73025 RepID=A0A7S4CC90_9EUGL
MGGVLNNYSQAKPEPSAASSSSSNQATNAILVTVHKYVQEFECLPSQEEMDHCFCEAQSTTKYLRYYPREHVIAHEMPLLTELMDKTIQWCFTYACLVTVMLVW